jgi:hypothetical protein
MEFACCKFAGIDGRSKNHQWSYREVERERRKKESEEEERERGGGKVFRKLSRVEYTAVT